ncbi:hypothetical protein QCB45_06820 [Thiomicrorhabdus sp. ZW0627]|uniref:hypothetical protein n=1 Tax=Thiomicrorhabdus sp. ZW0627 TaxID=3039774 RepID=UPI0024372437|nr:hypothetical protein [Thiomicrorhabdus sp. ZW0627]MDG6774038.1 hypothetical protein [Thiomicrorhabdus sp. ZW0627]
MTTEHAPLHWIQLELLPLPVFEEEFNALMLWWNPEEGVLLGEGSEFVLQLIDEASQAHALCSSSGGHFEVTDPLRKASELAAILAQYYWVIPQPVESPGQVNDSNQKDLDHLLQ